MKIQIFVSTNDSVEILCDAIHQLDVSGATVTIRSSTKIQSAMGNGALIVSFQGTPSEVIEYLEERAKACGTTTEGAVFKLSTVVDVEL